MSAGTRSLYSSLLGLVLVLLASAIAGAVGQPYSDFSKRGAGFYGSGADAPDPHGLVHIKIGLTGPSNSIAGKQMMAAVRLAVDEANASGGYHGVPYELVVRADDGPWGTAAKKVVELAYDEQVWAILGSLDGERAHLAELLAAKAWIPIITPCAQDRSIDYANVPWMFRCMPDDRKQADALLQYAQNQKYERVTVLSEGTRVGRMGIERLKTASRHLQHPISHWFEYSVYNPQEILPRLDMTTPDAIVVWGGPNSLPDLLPALHNAYPDTPILAPASATQIASTVPLPNGIVSAAPYDLSRPSSALLDFQERFTEASRLEVSPTAVFSYDAARLLIASIESAGLNRVRIRNALSRLEFHTLTGTLRFDGLGGNPAAPILLKHYQGQWFHTD